MGDGDGDARLGPTILVVGGLIGSLFAAIAMYAGSKIGLIDGGNVPAAILAFAALSALSRRPTIHAGNLVQTMSSSAAMMAITGGMIGPLAAMHFANLAISIPLAIAWGIALGVIGSLAAVRLRDAFITRGKLPFPSGIATASVLTAVFVERTASRQLWLLIAGASLAFTMVTLRGVFDLFPETLALPWAIGGLVPSEIGLGISTSPLLVGAGYLGGARTALSLALGAVIAWFVVAPLLVASGIADRSFGELFNWLMWPGTALMLGGTVGPIIATWRDLRRSLRDVAASDARYTTRDLTILVFAIVGVTVIGLIAFGIHPGLTLCGLALAAMLLSPAARANGETDNTPAGPLGGFGQVVIGMASSGGISTPLAGGGAINGVLMHAAMMLQNWKTGALVGSSPRRQLSAQLAGVAIGAVTCVATFALLDRAYGMGSEALPAPAGRSWLATALLVQHGVAALPPSAPIAAAAAFAAGIALSIPKLAERAPSPTALGLAFMVPATTSLTLALGGLIAAVIGGRSKLRHDGLSVAAGAIAGEALAGLMIAVLIIARVIESQ